MKHLMQATSAALLLTAAASAQVGGPFNLTWSTIDCGGAGSNNPSAGGAFQLLGTVGQHDTALLSGGAFELRGGFWTAESGAVPCYADCDESGTLDFFDFLCFQNEFSAGSTYADCDASGALDFFDFLCFQNEFSAGCP